MAKKKEKRTPRTRFSPKQNFQTPVGKKVRSVLLYTKNLHQQNI